LMALDACCPVTTRMRSLENIAAMIRSGEMFVEPMPMAMMAIANSASVRNTMVVKGTVLGLAGGGGTALTSVIFNMAMATNGDSIDLTKLAINYWDSDIVEPLALDAANSGDPSKSTVTPGDWSYYLSDGSAGSALKDNLAVYIVVAVPAGAAAFSYATITIQVIPPGASAVTIQRTLPPISAAMALA